VLEFLLASVRSVCSHLLLSNVFSFVPFYLFSTTLLSKETKTLTESQHRRSLSLKNN
jgi:hypothetical protein